MLAKNLKALLILAILAVAACAAPPRGGDIPAPKADQGLIVFYRLNSFAGSAIRFNLNSSEGPLGQLTNGSIIYNHLPPGDHQFWSQVISQDAIAVKVEAGKTYFVKGEVLMGVFAGRPKFTQMPEAQAQVDLATLR